jgi:ABC-2 type transport system permease protein
MVVNQVDVSSTILWMPLILIEIYFLALGLSMFLSAAFVRFRDIGYIWDVVLQAAFYITPIIYGMSKITNINMQKVLLLNPMAQAIQDARYAAITHDTITTQRVFGGGLYALVPIILVVLVLVGGFSYFKKESKYFAENI